MRDDQIVRDTQEEQRIPYPIDAGHAIEQKLERMKKELSVLKSNLVCVLNMDEIPDASTESPVNAKSLPSNNNSALMKQLSQLNNKADIIIDTICEISDHLDL